MPDLHLITICGRCSRPIAAVPVDGSWREAEAWSWLAHRNHRCGASDA